MAHYSSFQRLTHSIEFHISQFGGIDTAPLLTGPGLLEGDVSLAGALQLFARLGVEHDRHDAEEGEAGRAGLGRGAAGQGRYHMATRLSLQIGLTIATRN